MDRIEPAFPTGRPPRRKHVILLGDGMADLPVPALGGRTPLQAARTPHADRLARSGLCGLARTIPDQVPPASDTANMAVMGYDPIRYYSGRSPLEAVSMGIGMDDSDVAYRCNLVTLTGGAGEPFAERTMIDHSADEIDSETAARLIGAVASELARPGLRFHPGRSYRHLMIWQEGPEDIRLTPPHDILTQAIAPYLPYGDRDAEVLALMDAGARILQDHPLNRERVAAGLRPANAIWIWGQGRKPRLPRLAEGLGLSGSVIAAVDLIQGLGICAGLRVVEVPGATGTLHTDYSAKARAAMAELAAGQDYVYLHVEAPDECGHRAEAGNKVLAIERIDERILGPLAAFLDEWERQHGVPYRILFLPDHPTPVSLRTHTRDPVPFVLYSSDGEYGEAGPHPADAYDEASCAGTGFVVEEGYRLFSLFTAPPV